MSIVRDALILAGWAAGWIITARLLFVWHARAEDCQHQDIDHTFAPVVSGLIWPLLLAVAIALLPFIAVGWLISRPTRTRT